MWKRFEKEVRKRRIRASFFVQPVLEWRTDSGREKDEGVFGDFFVSVGYSCNSVVVLQMPGKRKRGLEKGQISTSCFAWSCRDFRLFKQSWDRTGRLLFRLLDPDSFVCRRIFLSRMDPLVRKEQADFWKKPDFYQHFSRACCRGNLSGGDTFQKTA